MVDQCCKRPDFGILLAQRNDSRVVTVSGDSFDPDLVFAFRGTF